MKLPLPTTLHDLLHQAVIPALTLLPKNMDSAKARVMLLAIAQQESGLEHRWQVISRAKPDLKGPARGLWQFERGSKASRGGVWGVYLHRASMEYLRLLCRERDCAFEPSAIWAQIEVDDIFAAGVARLLLWTDASPLPALTDPDGAWECYAERTWRPGKPHRLTWNQYHAAAIEEVLR